MTEPDLSAGSQLCTRCGLCCTGALHDYVHLDADEIDHARALGMKLKTDSTKLGFLFPCPHLRGTVCSTYLNRPRACGNYRCQLLRDVEDGRTTLEDARGKSAVARRLMEQAAAALGHGETFMEARRRVVDQRGPAPPGFAALKLAMTALELYLDRHFRRPKETPMCAMTTVEPAEGTDP